jgi:hypothetical protein
MTKLFMSDWWFYSAGVAALTTLSQFRQWQNRILTTERESTVGKCAFESLQDGGALDTGKWDVSAFIVGTRGSKLGGLLVLRWMIWRKKRKK